jgi:hypothetical protein
VREARKGEGIAKECPGFPFWSGSWHVVLELLHLPTI